MANVRSVTKGLQEIGAAWAVSTDKYICTNHQCCNVLDGDRPAYHVHPNASYPHQNDIMRFTSLKEVERYIKARKASVKARNDYGDQFDCPTPQECEAINEEADVRAMRVMEDYYDSLR